VIFCVRVHNRFVGEQLEVLVNLHSDIMYGFIGAAQFYPFAHHLVGPIAQTVHNLINSDSHPSPLTRCQLHQVFGTATRRSALSSNPVSLDLPSRPKTKNNGQRTTKSSLSTRPPKGLGEECILQPTEKWAKRTTGLGKTPAIPFRFYKLFRSCSRADPKWISQVGLGG
jgi:hypothetical protein